jgi:hypothetical protein
MEEPTPLSTRTQPSQWQVRNELYGLLCMAAAAIVFFVFLGTASDFFPGPDWLWYVAGFAGLFWMEFLIQQKFDSPRSRI